MSKGAIIAIVAAVAVALYLVFSKTAGASPLTGTQNVSRSAAGTTLGGAGGIVGTNATNPFSAFSAGLAALETALNGTPTLSGTPGGGLNAATATPAQLSSAGLKQNTPYGSAGDLTINPSDLVPASGTPQTLGQIETSNQLFDINNPVTTDSSFSSSLSTANLSNEDIQSLVGGNNTLSFSSQSYESGDPFSGISGADLTALEQ